MDYEENNRYVHDYEDDGQPIPGTKIGYDNTGSGLDSTTVQGAIDEVAQILDTKQDKSYDGTESGIEADTVTGAIDELAQDVSDLTDIVEKVVNKVEDKYMLVGNRSRVFTHITSYATSRGAAWEAEATDLLDTLADDEAIIINKLVVGTLAMWGNLNNVGIITKQTGQNALKGFWQGFVATDTAFGVQILTPNDSRYFSCTSAGITPRVDTNDATDRAFTLYYTLLKKVTT
jgi:hypothetical protein